ncbi:MAG: hypothetical protein IH840_14900, partial [Candidatus Heimdallarchaeota archaeon]|nr:hypothetical protein [Candidatus Heimdallarchaeota archaeon]
LHLLNVASPDPTAIFGLQVEEKPVGSDPANPHIWAGIPFTFDFTGNFPWVEWVFADFGSAASNTYKVTATCSAGYSTYDSYFVNIYDTELTPIDPRGWSYCSETDFPEVQTTGPIYVEVRPDDDLDPISIDIQCTSCPSSFTSSGRDEHTNLDGDLSCNNTILIFVDLVWENLDESIVDIQADWRSDYFMSYLILDPLAIAGTGSQTIDVLAVTARAFDELGFVITVKLNGEVVNIIQFGWLPQCIEFFTPVATTTESGTLVILTTVVTTGFGEETTITSTFTSGATTITSFSPTTSTTDRLPLVFVSSFIMSIGIMIIYIKNHRARRL